MKKSSLSFIESNEPGPLCLKLSDSGLLSASTKNNHRVCGIALSSVDPLDWREFPGLLKKCADSLETPLAELKWKVVAHVGISANLLALLSQHKVALEHQIIRQDPVEIWFWPAIGKLIASKTPEKPTLSTPEKLFEKARVLIVDDSKTIRTLLSSVLKEDPDIEVVALAERPSQVEDLIRKHQPNVITLDIHMPEMDGVTLFKQIFPRYRIPTIMISSLSPQEGPEVLSALEAGAFDYIKKPELHELDEVAHLIREKVKAAAKTKPVAGKSPQKTVQSDALRVQGELDMNRIIAIGSSTGGTEALRVILTKLPKNIPPILITQHIPAVFSAALAKRLNDLCPFEVREARDGDELMSGLALIAPGGLQMTLQKGSGGQFHVRVGDDAPVNRHKPSVDVLFDSVAPIAGSKCVGIILTGMGADGAAGLLKLRNAGARTIAQDEESCVVFGMPKQAIELGGVEKIVGLEQIASVLLSCLQKNRKAS